MDYDFHSLKTSEVPVGRKPTGSYREIMDRLAGLAPREAISINVPEAELRRYRAAICRVPGKYATRYDVTTRTLYVQLRGQF